MITSDTCNSCGTSLPHEDVGHVLIGWLAGAQENRQRKALERKARRAGCIDCGNTDEQTGHMECPYPGRYSDS